MKNDIPMTIVYFPSHLNFNNDYKAAYIFTFVTFSILNNQKEMCFVQSCLPFYENVLSRKDYFLLILFVKLIRNIGYWTVF